MFDIGWSEMAIIMLLALIIIGPKDLPRVARTVGQWVRKGRMLAREFQTSLEDMAKEAELDDVKKEIEKVGKTDLKSAVENTIDPKGDLKKAFETSDGAAGEETVGKVLNGGGKAKAVTAENEIKSVSADTKAESPAPAKAAETKETSKASATTTSSQTATSKAKKPANPKTAVTTAKPAKPRTAASTKKPAASTRKPASAAKKPAAKKPAAPRKRAAKPASSAKSGDTPASTDDGGATMAAKSS